MKHLSTHSVVATSCSGRSFHRQQQQLRPPTVRHGASRRSIGQARLQHQTCYGRRRAQDYDEEEYEESYEQGVPDEPPSPPQRSFPVLLAIPGALLLAFAVFRIFKKIQGRGWERHADVTTLSHVLALSILADLQISQRAGV